MRRKRQSLKDRLAAGHVKLITLLPVPVILFVLILVIAAADRGGGEEIQTAADEPAASEAETDFPALLEPGGQSGSGAAPADDGGDGTADTEDSLPQRGTSAGLLKDPVPEILSLMQSYFSARASADAETILRLYGNSEPSAEEISALHESLLNNARYVEGFENIATYLRQEDLGETALVYVRYDIRFYAVDTTAPMIMWCFVREDTEGGWLLLEESALSEELEQLVEISNHSEEVRRLSSSVNTKLKEALNADEDLNEVYGVLREGSPVYGLGEEESAVIVWDGGTAGVPDGSGQDASGSPGETDVPEALDSAAAPADAQE